MNHQVQGLVLVDNEWVSRPLDVYQIMAQAQQDDTEMREPPVKPAVKPRIPGYGIFSRTVLPTPLYRFILPANIRHRGSNDVVLVGEDSVRLVEIRDYGRLQNVAVKSDFSGRVLAARVLGSSGEDRDIGSGASLLPDSKIASTDGFSQREDGEQCTPPEVVVLTLTSRTLMFLWTQRSATKVDVFRHKTIKLPASSSRFDRLGQYLAVDPKRRAMAVGAYEGRFILYKTRSMQTWRGELHSDVDSTPIEDERIVSIEGRIMHMDFLTSADGMDDYHVVLLFVIAHQGLTKLTCFDWDCRYDLSTVTARTERVSVDLDDQNPSVLVTLARSPDFLLIFDTHVSVYKDVLSGAPQRLVIPIPDHITALIHPGDSVHRPLWVRWDRAPRISDYSKECFYIAREDGRIMYLEIGPAGGVDMDDAGEWPYRIDTAFACLSIGNAESPHSVPDIIMTGAAGNDAFLCKVGAWPMEYSYATQYPTMNQFTYVESMPNWTPVTGLCVTEFPRAKEFHGRERSAIFVSNGLAPYGKVSELRYGLRAAIDHAAGGMDGCTGLWILHYGSQTVELDGKRARQHYVYVLLSLPPETLLFRLIRTQPDVRGDFPGSWDDGVWDITQLPTEDEPVDDGIARDEETISACLLSDQHSIQITRQNAQLLNLPTLALSSKFDFPTPVLLAASSHGCPYIAFAFKDDGDTYLDVLSILEDGTFAKYDGMHSRHPLSADPTCIELFDISGQTHVFVGTFDSKVWLFQVSSARGLSQVFRSTLDAIPSERSRTLCEGAAILTLDGSETIVCATRNGLLLSQDIRVINPQPAESPTATGQNMSGSVPTPRSPPSWNITRMGSMSAHIYPSSIDPATAFVSCGSEFCQIRLFEGKPGTIRVDSIWLTDRSDPGYLQRPVTAAYQLPRMAAVDARIGRDLGGFLFVVSGKEMLCTQIDVDMHITPRERDARQLSEHILQPLPRNIITGAKPTYTAYLTLPRKLLVATIEVKEECAPPDGYRTIHSSLNLVGMHDEGNSREDGVKQEEGVELTKSSVIAQYTLNNAERVYSVADWAYEDDRGKKYNLIIVGTGIREGPGKESGRKLIFNLGQRGSRLSLQKESSYSHPVYCVAMFDGRATVSVIGKDLYFDEFDASLGRWFNRGVKGLPSPGIHVTVSRTTVYVSTLQHSLLCYEVTRRLDSSKVDIEQLFTDSRERSLTHHLVLQNDDLEHNPLTVDESLVLVTDKKTAAVSGLYSTGESTLKGAANTIFEACLPRTVIRLQRGNIRPPWRRPFRLAGYSQKDSGILVDNIIGACSDGTIYSFAIIAEPARHVLRLLQNIIELKQQRSVTNRFTVVKHRSSDIFNVLMNGADGAQDHEIRARNVDPRYEERGAVGSRHSHIDGDLLARYFQEGGDLKDLVVQGVDEDVSSLFVELAGLLLPQGSYHMRGRGATWDEVVLAVKEWLDEVLMPLL
ncbi:hypothetical protein E8E13_004422 [Curvularia kusanoi]|uniref:RSE1/DDB1/CPSF1 first beta-propeller domain-containing protein n=1 Tax=Curvularia kusanoi TaxID=90978 RepID=A0A9P4T9M4_CURKU|nr:hypothetical protein E8E13_004422 [Curvularia kusanoi]